MFLFAAYLNPMVSVDDTATVRIMHILGYVFTSIAVSVLAYHCIEKTMHRAIINAANKSKWLRSKI